MKPSEVLREARNVLFERGWTQHAAQNEQGKVCSVGALALAHPDIRIVKHWGIVTSTPESTAEYDAARHYLNAVVAGIRIERWNDEPDRTFSEVVEAFDKAEKLAEADGQ